MTVKKNPKLNLEKKRLAFFQIGLLLVASMALVAFEWDTFKVQNLSQIDEQFIEEEIVKDFEEEDDDIIEEELPIPEPVQQASSVNLFIPDADSVIAITDEFIGLSLPEIPKIPIQTGGDGTGIIGQPIKQVEEDYVVVGVMPEFTKGSLMTYIKKHVDYPREAVEIGAEGKVYVQFVVTKHGKVDKVKVIKSEDEMLNKAAKEVIKNLPGFTPGKQMGRPVNVIMTVPINFILG